MRRFAISIGRNHCAISDQKENPDIQWMRFDTHSEAREFIWDYYAEQIRI